MEKRPKNSTIKPLPGEGGATEKRPTEKITIKPLSTISVPCIKFQGGHGPPLPTPMVVSLATFCLPIR